MVAEVIKLPSATTNSIQTTNANSTVKQLKLPGGGPQPEVSKQADRLAEQAAKNAEIVRQAVSEVNQFVQQIKTNLQFSVDEASGRSVITVVDSETGDVIRQIPAKEILAVANSLRELSALGADRVGIILADQG